MKQCSKCKKTLPESQFQKAGKKRDGTQRYDSKCKACCKKYRQSTKGKEATKRWMNKQPGGVYAITCWMTDQVYVGSSLYLYQRESNHWRMLELSTHTNPNLQAAWDKYGRDAFDFEILDFYKGTCRRELFALEQHYINRYSEEELFNCLPALVED